MDIQTDVIPLIIAQSYASPETTCDALIAGPISDSNLTLGSIVTNEITYSNLPSNTTLSAENAIVSQLPLTDINALYIPNINVGTLQLTGASPATGPFVASNVQLGSDLTVANVYTQSLTTDRINTSSTVTCNSLIADEIQAPSLTYTGVNTQQYAFSTGTFTTFTSPSATINTCTATGSQSDTTSANTINADGGFSVPDNTMTTTNLIHNSVGTPYYSVPQSTTVRGLMTSPYFEFGKNIPSTVSSMIMSALTGASKPAIIGFNEYLGTFDNSTGYGGNTALLSLSNQTSPYRTLRYETTGNLRIYSTPATVLWESGTAISDGNMKEDIKTVMDAMETIMKLKPVSFEYTGDAEGCGKSVGFIVEDTEDVFPHCVRKTGAKNSIIDLTKIVPLLVAGFKELKEMEAFIESKSKTA